jgi:hypothetical protein
MVVRNRMGINPAMETQAIQTATTIEIDLSKMHNRK